MEDYGFCYPNFYGHVQFLWLLSMDSGGKANILYIYEGQRLVQFRVFPGWIKYHRWIMRWIPRVGVSPTITWYNRKGPTFGGNQVEIAVRTRCLPYDVMI